MALCKEIECVSGNFCDFRQYFLTAVVNLELSCQALVRSSTVAGSNCCGAPVCKQSLNHTISSKERVRAEVGDRGKIMLQTIISGQAIRVLGLYPVSWASLPCVNCWYIWTLYRGKDCFL